MQFMFFFSSCPRDFHGICKGLESDFFFKTKHFVKAAYHCTCHFPGALLWKVTLRYLWSNYTEGQYLAKTSLFLLYMLCEIFNHKGGFMLKSWLWFLMITELFSNGTLKESWKSWDWVFLESVSTNMKEQNNSFFPFIFQFLFLTLEYRSGRNVYDTSKRQLVVQAFCTAVMHPYGIMQELRPQWSLLAKIPPLKDRTFVFERRNSSGWKWGLKHSSHHYQGKLGLVFCAVLPLHIFWCTSGCSPTAEWLDWSPDCRCLTLSRSPVDMQLAWELVPLFCLAKPVSCVGFFCFVGFGFSYMCIYIFI